MAKCTGKLSLFLGFLAILASCSSSPPPASYSAESEESFRSQEPSGESASDNRMVTYTVTLRLFVSNPEETRRILVEQVNNNNGYIVIETDNHITTRIPAENMENFLSSARPLGNIELETRTGTDITDQYRDNVIRLESLRSVRDRYLALLARANTISEILSIERELERMNMEIERLEGRIKHAELSVAYSSITVSFRERSRPGPISWIFYGLYLGVKWLFVWN
ncbi:MAG: DUF4349 domain-containing protein [Treponema sp.]|jgi:hypothetical protein|nr:DUF4349 domain-containing protein [Treponema sp.]